MDRNAKIYVAGHKGLVGSAIVRYKNIITRTHGELDLKNQKAVEEFWREEEPEYVYLAAAKVGGILANDQYPADFIYENLMIQNNVIKAAHDFNAKKLLFLGSTCIYPKNAPQPIKEEYLLSGFLEPTNEAYAIAKIAGLEMCKFFKRQYGDNFISCMPTNLYGPYDNFDLKSSHVLPALIRKLWGTGTPLREFLHVDDMADACIFLMENYNGEEHVNIGTGEEVSIKQLAETVKEIIGYKGQLLFNSDKPDGTPRKLTDITKLHELGWKHSINLKEGIEDSYKWFKENY